MVNLGSLSFQDALISLAPLVWFVAGVVVYSLFIFKFYRFVARRDVFKLDISKYKEGSSFIAKIVHGIAYLIKYIFLFPVLVFFWFIVLSLFLVFLTKSMAISDVLLTSMALVGSIRIVSYYDEDLSKDLAKMMPFALLGVFLLDIRNFSQAESLALLWEIPAMWLTLVYYLGFVIVLEFTLRVLHGIVALFTPGKDI